jgi:ribosome maturation factor RimP
LEVREEVRQLAEPLAAEDGLELVDVELLVQGGRRTIRVLLDRPGGIRVADCARFSRRLSDCLDMNQTVPWTYHLEVSSPGLQRPIRTLASVERFAGERVALTTVEAHEGRRHFEGALIGPAEGRAGVRDDEGHEHWFEWADVKDAHLIVDPWAGRRSAGTQGGGRR